MTYEQMEAEIAAVPKFGAKASLSNLTKYLDRMNHPERNLRVIHIAGTNGKGSVCAFLDAILREAGYKTALFTSPHLIYLNERFRMNGKCCEDGELISAWTRVKEEMAVGQKEGLQPLTYFEILFLMGLLIFQEKDPDYCIMETGLGGRLDATVLTRPLLSIITSISLDHTAILGDTVEEIAKEKAGIIKKGVPVVALDEENGAFPVILREAEEKGSRIYKVRSKDITILKKYKNKIDFSIKSRYYKDNPLTICSFADYQIYNAALAFIAVHVLLSQINEETVRRGLLHMRWEGRMEELLPGVYLDGAHNPGAIAQICACIGQSEETWSLLFAVCSDKDYSAMIHMLAELPWKKIYIARVDEARGASVEEVRRQFITCCDTPVIGFDDAISAMERALSDRRENKERLLCLGSLYLVGELKRWKQIEEKSLQSQQAESEDMS